MQKSTGVPCPPSMCLGTRQPSSLYAFIAPVIMQMDIVLYKEKVQWLGLPVARSTMANDGGSAGMSSMCCTMNGET